MCFKHTFIILSGVNWHSVLGRRCVLFARAALAFLYATEQHAPLDTVLTGVAEVPANNMRHFIAQCYHATAMPDCPSPKTVGFAEMSWHIL